MGLGDVRIRVATDSDAAPLRSLEERAPLVTGDLTFSIDRGEDWFAPTRLQHEAIVLIAERGETPIGVVAGALHSAPLAGAERPLLYVHQARVPPEHQRQGLGLQLVADLLARCRGRSETPYWFIESENKASQGFARDITNKWTTGPFRLTLDAIALAGPEAGRPATSIDAPYLAEIWNAAHDGEELFARYTDVSVRERLEKAPDLYTYSDVYIDEGAAVGVWDQACHVTVKRQDEVLRSGPTALVLDYGCVPGGEDALARLLRAACGRVVSNGTTTLSLFSSHAARCHPVVSELATESTRFDLWTPVFAEPESASTAGIHVDPVYF